MYRHIVSAIFLGLFSGLILSCDQSEPTNLRSVSGETATVKLGIRAFADDGLALTGTATNSFVMVIECNDGYSQTVTTGEFTLPINATGCLGKLQEFTDGGQVYRPTANFSTFQPPEMATFSNGTENVFVYVLAQLPPTLNTFAEIRYKWSDNREDLAVGIESAEVNFSRAVVGDQPEPMKLVRAFSPRSGEVDLVFECDTNIIGTTIENGICGSSATRNLRVAVLPFPSVSITQSFLESQMASQGNTLGLLSDALLIFGGQWFTTRGGVTAHFNLPTVAPNQDYLVVLSQVGSQSFVHSRLEQPANPNPAIFSVSGNISGLGTSSTISLSLNGTGQNFSANGNFSFTRLLSDLAAYEVTITNAPSGHTCAIANNEGSISGANVADVQVTCVSN